MGFLYEALQAFFLGLGCSCRTQCGIEYRACVRCPPVAGAGRRATSPCVPAPDDTTSSWSQHSELAAILVLDRCCAHVADPPRALALGRGYATVDLDRLRDRPRRMRQD